MGTLWKFLKWRFMLARSDRKDSPKYLPEYAQPDLARIHNPDPSKVQLTWVGHSTFLIQVAGMNILTDPIWSQRASPVRWVGPRRSARPGIIFKDLPRIDLVFISHTHYDHLDRPTILKLGPAPRYVVPEGVAPWFAKEGISNVTELSWWKSETAGALSITAVPAKHWSKRWVYVDEHMGWGGYVIQSPAGAIYFAGDTGYHDEYFKEIGKRFPDIDLALIPIGAYYPRTVFGRFHIDPREALQVHKETGAKKSIGMHWGTFKLTQEPLQEPPQELARQREVAGMSSEEFSEMKIGETRIR
jgi:L-ascorbate metabolism protein UlaG (beta-lactamase superfamily)